MRLYRAALRVSFGNMVAYQGSFWLYAAVQALSYLTIPFVYLGIISQNASVSGLDSGYILLLTAISQLVAIFYDFLIGTGVEEFASRVASGDLDYWFVRPFRNPLTHLLLCPGTLGLFGLPIPIWLFCLTGNQKVWQHPGSVLLSIVMVVVALASRSAYGLLYAAASVRLTRVYALGHLINTAFSYSAFPATLYRGATKLVVTYIIPVALVANVPTSTLLLGRLTPEAIVLVACSLLLLAIGWISFVRSTKHYMSCTG